MKLLKIGFVLRSYGSKLFVRFYPKYVPASGDKIYFENKKFFKGPYRIASITPYKNDHLIKISKMDLKPKDYKGCSIGVEGLPEGSFFIDDLIGCEVFDTSNEFLGKLENVIKTGATDVYQIKCKDGTELLIPATREAVLKVDLNRRKILVNLSKGVINEN